MPLSIPVQFVDVDEYQALEVAIAAAEFSASLSKKPKIFLQTPLSSSNPPCNFHTDAVSAVHLGLTSDNKLECLTVALSAGKGASCSTSLHGSAKEACLRSPENIAADEVQYLQSEPCYTYAIDSECGSCCGISNEEACLKSTRTSEIIQADEASFHKTDAGNACVDICENRVLPQPDNTEKLDPCSSHKGPLHEDTLRKYVSSRRLPSWPSSSDRCWHENSSPSGHAEIRPTIRHGVDNQLASILDLPEASYADYRLPWGFLPRTCKVTTKCKLPSFHFKGQINYSDSVLDAEHAANELLKQVEAMKAANCSSVPIGFDTEWKVVFKRGAQRRKVAVLQLCIDADKCNVFHVIHSGIPSSLKSILEDPLVFKVGVGAYGDAEKLCTDYNVKVKGVKDLSGLANLKMVGFTNKSWSLSSLAEELLGKQVDKTPSIRMGDWEVEKLSEAQLQYAATDAFASLYLFQVLVTFPDPR